MKKSFSYYIILFVLRLKGVKNAFRQDPIDFERLRREDVHHPKKSLFKNCQRRSFSVKHTLITEVKKEQASDRLLIFIHGGAFVSGPAEHHWHTVAALVKGTGQLVWMCDYPKAPEADITSISENMDAVYRAASEAYPAEHITLIGDSVGGTLITALIQRLLIQGGALPSRAILISPVMDATMSHPDIATIDDIDPMLSVIGVRSAKRMCAGALGLEHPSISPLHGSFQGFPETVMYVATADITYPDQQLAAAAMREAGVPLTLILGEGMPHIWPILPVMKEAEQSLQDMIGRLNE